MTYDIENFQKFIASNYSDPSTRYQVLFKSLHDLCSENNWGDPFSYARSREIHMATILGHTIADTYSGADAIDEDGECEYKSTINEKINATYNGISVFPTWEEQVKYLKEEKICKYKNHYYSRYENGTIQDIWKMDGEVVYNLIIEPLKKKFDTVKTKKDPRLGVTISESNIKKYGTRIYHNAD